MIDLFGRFNEKANRNDKGVFSFNLFLILFCLQSAKCHVTEFRNVWLALLKWLGFCLGTKKDVAKMIKKNQSNTQRNRLLASVRKTKLQLLRTYKKLDTLQQRKVHLNRHIIDVCARFTFLTRVWTAEEKRKVFVLYSTIEALWKRDGLHIENERKEAEEKKRALTACLARLEKRLRQ